MSHHRSLKGNCLRVVKAQAVLNAKFGTAVHKAGQSMMMKAAQVHNAGSGLTHLQAGEDFTLSTLQVESSHDITWSQHNYHRQSSSAEVGTQISGGGAVNLVAQDDLSARAAMVNSLGALSLQSTDGSVNIEAGQSTEGIQTGSHLQAGGWLASKAVTQTSNTQVTTAQGSELGGQTVSIQSGADTRIVGSNLLANERLDIQAGGDLSIEAAQNTQSSSQFQQTRRSGVFGFGGLGITIGSQQQSTDAQNQRTTAAASTVGFTCRQQTWSQSKATSLDREKRICLWVIGSDVPIRKARS